MVVFYFACVGVITLAAYYFVLPLHKNRPILVRQRGLTALGVSLSLISFPSFGVWSLAIAILIAMLFFTTEMWLVYGITTIHIFEALEKASNITRSPVEHLADVHLIDSSTKIKSYKLCRKLNLVIFSTKKYSKRVLITKEVFRKFIQNYLL